MGTGDVRWGSDLVVDALQALGIEHVAMNPGASYRGLHDSLVHAGRPGMVMTLFEGVAVAVAHGYAKAAGRPMAVALHDLVGLQHGSMAIFNAFMDQVPMLVLGGAGPADTARRRPWIDWIHSPSTQGQFIRELVKWDSEPASIESLAPSLERAHRLACTAPAGPTYVAIDSLLQEAEIACDTGGRGVSPPIPHVGPDPDAIAAAADVLIDAERPLVVADLVGRTRRGFDALRELVEVIGARVVDLGGSFNFPNDHLADGSGQREQLLAAADVVLVLEARDHEFALGTMRHDGHGWQASVASGARVVSIGMNALLHRGFLDREGPRPIDLEIVAEASVALPALVAETQRRRRQRETAVPWRLTNDAAPQHDPYRSSLGRLAIGAFRAVRDGPWLLANGDLHGWVRRTWKMTAFGSHLGHSGGAGLGYGPGAAIGAALAHHDDDTLVVSFQSDGDLFYTPSALWTAAHHRLAVLWLVVNNRTYGQDRMHQTLVAQMRDREHDVGTGIDIVDPSVDVAALARAHGVEGWGPIDTHDVEALTDALSRAAAIVRNERRPMLVDVLVDYEGGRT